MSHKPIPAYTETELWIVRQTLKERYGEDIRLEVATGEVRLDPSERVLTTCPALYWQARGANFVIVKVGTDRYRAQFYYRGFEQFATGKLDFDNIGDCIVTLLQVQSDHERERAAHGEKLPAAAGDQPQLNRPEPDEEWYYQPVIWE
jgi:hypothetical protein